MLFVLVTFAINEAAYNSETTRAALQSVNKGQTEDEPTSALDPELVGEVLQTIKKTVATGLTMILFSHENEHHI